jgi:hypothetical protein
MTASSLKIGMLSPLSRALENDVRSASETTVPRLRGISDNREFPVTTGGTIEMKLEAAAEQKKAKRAARVGRITGILFICVSTVAILVSLILTVTCRSTDQPPLGTPMSKSDSSTIVELPEPQLRGEQSLEQKLASRRSIREFTDKPLTNAELSQLLWAAQGVN